MGFEELRTQILAQFPSMGPQLRQAAQYALDNPSEVAVSSVRKLAEAAGVKPNTFMRLAWLLGFNGFEEFREPYRKLVTRTGESFPDRARWLQSLAKSGQHGHLYSQMASSSISNVEHLFSATRIDELSDLARRMVAARNVFILGLGTCFSVAHGFWYVGRMAVDNFTLLPQHGALPMDDISRLSAEDVLVVVSFNPYRSEVAQSARLARARGAYVVSITDSQASPASLGADRVLVTPTRTPQFFPSTQAATALLETLLAFIIAESGAGVIDRINAFHRLREETGAYERGFG